MCSGSRKVARMNKDFTFTGFAFVRSVFIYWLILSLFFFSLSFPYLFFINRATTPSTHWLFRVDETFPLKTNQMVILLYVSNCLDKLGFSAQLIFWSKKWNYNKKDREEEAHLATMNVDRAISTYIFRNGQCALFLFYFSFLFPTLLRKRRMWAHTLIVSWLVTGSVHVSGRISACMREHPPSIKQPTISPWSLSSVL